MQDVPAALAAPRKLWVRALLMLLFAFAFQLAAWLLVGVAVLQLVLAATTGAPHARLRQFGRSLGLYLGTIAAFEAFDSEDLPFPFADWPPA